MVRLDDYLTDNGSDQQARLQAAINAVGNGVMIGNGKEYYLSAGVTIRQGFRFIGMRTTFWSERDIAVFNLDLTADIYYLDIDDLALRSQVPTAAYGVSAYPRAFLLRGAGVLRRSTIRNVHMRGFWNGFASDSRCEWVRIDGNMFDNFEQNVPDQPIRVLGGMGISQITNNRLMSRPGGRGMYLRGHGLGDLLIALNQCEGSGQGGDVGLDLEVGTAPGDYGERFEVMCNKFDTYFCPIRRVNIQGSTFEGNGFAGGAVQQIYGLRERCIDNNPQ